MNSQIRKIAKDCGLSISQAYSAEFNKFAEAIVKECARVANDSNQSKNRAVGVSVGDVVRNHFGVE